jgi:hypothetical protein
MNPADYLNNPNTIFGKATQFDKDVIVISNFVGKVKHSIGWDGIDRKYIVYIHSRFVWIWHRYITGKFKDRDYVIYKME